MRALLDLLPAERAELALRLGERCLTVYAAYQDVDRETALGRIRVRSQIGRRHSRCMQDN
jgi:hypothetical protein